MAETRYDPAEMAARGRIGAYRLHATHDPKETTVAARAALWSKFERDVDPEGVLAPEGARPPRWGGQEGPLPLDGLQERPRSLAEPLT